MVLSEKLEGSSGGVDSGVTQAVDGRFYWNRLLIATLCYGNREGR
jgi:hypothetical protein